MRITSALIVVAAIVTIHWMQTSHNTSMDKCQERQSYDTCMYLLVR